jgi:predicted nuclease with TOPRIM domain
MSIFSEIDRLITERGSAAILRERVALVKEQNESLQKKVVTLEGEILALQKRNAELEKMVERPEASYTMKWGCLKFDGDEKLYCPACYLERRKKIPTSRVNSSRRYCSVCKVPIPVG